MNNMIKMEYSELNELKKSEISSEKLKKRLEFRSSFGYASWWVLDLPNPPKTRPGTLPNPSMTPPRRPQTLPRCAYRHLRWLQDIPRTSQYASKSAQEASKVPQDSPRTPPRPSRGRFFELWWWIWGGFPFSSPDLSQKRWNQAWIQSSTLNMPIPACPHTFLLQDTAVPA